MGKCPKAVSEMYSQFKTKEAHPLERYVGRYVQVKDQKLEVIGYSKDLIWSGGGLLIVDGTTLNGWRWTESKNQGNVVFKKCEKYCYVHTGNLIN